MTSSEGESAPKSTKDADLVNNKKRIMEISNSMTQTNSKIADAEAVVRKPFSKWSDEEKRLYKNEKSIQDLLEDLRSELRTYNAEKIVSL